MSFVIFISIICADILGALNARRTPQMSEITYISDFECLILFCVGICLIGLFFVVVVVEFGAK